MTQFAPACMNRQGMLLAILIAYTAVGCQCRVTVRVTAERDGREGNAKAIKSFIQTVNGFEAISYHRSFGIRHGDVIGIQVLRQFGNPMWDEDYSNVYIPSKSGSFSDVDGLETDGCFLVTGKPPRQIVGLLLDGGERGRRCVNWFRGASRLEWHRLRYVRFGMLTPDALFILSRVDLRYCFVELFGDVSDSSDMVFRDLSVYGGLRYLKCEQCYLDLPLTALASIEYLNIAPDELRGGRHPNKLGEELVKLVRLKTLIIRYARLDGFPRIAGLARLAIHQSTGIRVGKDFLQLAKLEALQISNLDFEWYQRGDSYASRRFLLNFQYLPALLKYLDVSGSMIDLVDDSRMVRNSVLVRMLATHCGLCGGFLRKYDRAIVDRTPTAFLRYIVDAGVPVTACRWDGKTVTGCRRVDILPLLNIVDLHWSVEPVRGFSPCEKYRIGAALYIGDVRGVMMRIKYHDGVLYGDRLPRIIRLEAKGAILFDSWINSNLGATAHGEDVKSCR